MKKLFLVVFLMFCASLLFNNVLFAVGSEYDKHTVLIKYKGGVTKAQRYELTGQVNGNFKDKNNDGIDDRFHKIAKGRVAVIDLKGSGDDPAAAALQVLKDHPYIEYAQPNYYHYQTVMPNDTRFSEKWDLHSASDVDIDAPEAWEISTGSRDVVIGVIDGGFNYTHEDLAANAWINPGEIAGNGIDDDGNGYIDDIYGMNALNDNGNPAEGNGHGSHCAGIIGAVGNNGKGVVGVNWTCSIMGLRFINSTGSGTTAHAIECINYAVNMKH